MDIEKMKNMVVIKNLPSNMIEEAFIVLKDNVKVHTEELVGNKKDKESKKSTGKDYVIKEAELIIEEYATKLEKNKKMNIREKVKLEATCKKLKCATLFFAIISIFSVVTLLIK